MPNNVFNKVVFPKPFTPWMAIFLPRSMTTSTGRVNGSSYPNTRSFASTMKRLGVRPSLKPKDGFIFSCGFSKISIFSKRFALEFAIPRVATRALLR